MQATLNYLGPAPLFQIQADQYSVNGIDNDELALEVLANQTRMVNNPHVPGFEDTVFNANSGRQSKLLLEAIDGLVKGHGLKIVETWSHIHQPRESTGLHDHVSVVNEFAFVYYVKVPEGSGDLVFLLEDTAVAAITPNEGKLLFFPSWLKHRVAKNMGNETRISVSGNLVKC